MILNNFFWLIIKAKLLYHITRGGDDLSGGIHIIFVIGDFQGHGVIARVIKGMGGFSIVAFALLVVLGR